jgi:DNA-binding CsgD family transcriptional regulator
MLLPTPARPHATPDAALTPSHPAAVQFDRARLNLLMPEIAQAASADMLAYALAFVAHYPCDVALLEQEWEWLVAALRLAWHNGDHTAVARLATALAHVAGRIADQASAAEAVRRGIVACRRLGDIVGQARLMNCLGCLLNARGAYDAGWRVWRAGLLLEPSHMLGAIWEPCLSFAHITDLIGTSGVAHHFALPVTDDATEGAIVARFVHGYLARVHDDLATAWADNTIALRLLSQHECSTVAPPHHLLRAVIQTELARIQADYPRARAHALRAITLASLYADSYTHATLLIDHMLFAYWMGHTAEAQAHYPHLRAAAERITAPHVQRVCARWEATFFGDATPALPLPAVQRIGTMPSLSAREHEVLDLVAAGLSNQMIARQLVVTRATVKKHLEHIYGKIGVHSRTAAVAWLHTASTDA